MLTDNESLRHGIQRIGASEPAPPEEHDIEIRDAEDAPCIDREPGAQRPSERSLHRRIRELQEENDSLRRSGRLKDEFLATVGHELRNGINAVLGGMELLERFGPEFFIRGRTSALDVIESNARHLLGLLDDVLDLCKAESGRMKLKLGSVSVASVCAQAMNLVEGTVRSKRQTLDLKVADSIEAVRADPQRLRQILVNLLNNAAKFTEPGGRIGLRVRSGPQRATVLFEVWDTGPGLTAAQVAQLQRFAPFTQFEHGRRSGGSGLGLSLVKQLVDLHEGKLFIHSRQGAGSGSEFVVEIPAFAGEAAPAEQARVLLVDDNAATILATSTFLRSMGFDVLTADTAERALRLLRADQIDAVICDVRLPDMDGPAFAQQVRHDLRLATLPILALTADATPDMKEKCLAAGMSEFLMKPIRLTTLALELTRLCSRPGPRPAASSDQR